VTAYVCKMPSVRPPRGVTATPTSRCAAVFNQVDECISRRWQVKQASPARQLLAERVRALYESKQDDLRDLDDYVDAVEPIAKTDVERILTRSRPNAMLEGVVIGTSSATPSSQRSVASPRRTPRHRSRAGSKPTRPTEPGR
jgi:hypothetical protein